MSHRIINVNDIMGKNTQQTQKMESRRPRPALTAPGSANCVEDP